MFLPFTMALSILLINPMACLKGRIICPPLHWTSSSSLGLTGTAATRILFILLSRIALKKCATENTSLFSASSIHAKYLSTRCCFRYLLKFKRKKKQKRKYKEGDTSRLNQRLRSVHSIIEIMAQRLTTYVVVICHPECQRHEGFHPSFRADQREAKNPYCRIIFALSASTSNSSNWHSTKLTGKAFFTP